MRAATLASGGRLRIEERDPPRIERPDQVLLEVEACGICGTDLHILSSPPEHPCRVGVIMGHEFVGRVRAVGEAVAAPAVGDRVVVEANVACGQCGWCQRGLPSHCERFTTHGIFVDGGLAPRAVVPARSCHRISEAVPRHLAALAEPLSCVVNGVRLARVEPGETALVLGAGPIGLMFTALLRLAGSGVIAVEPAPRRRELAAVLGAERVVDPAREPVEEAVRAATGGIGADAVVDAVGTQLPVALDLVRPGGRVVLFGMNQRARAEVSQNLITRKEVQVLGAYVGRDVFPSAVRLLEQGRADLSPMVTDRIGLPELPAAVERLRRGEAVKVVVDDLGDTG
ncbi:MAG TPA: alcohol dehydrogenase catalytic domain-containing protein [Candidatus Dormibacteraeota bacterium]|jgi:threonine dehydrogenase-like Zn-dependent dehydrogenase|nr:alcohol dehydrogenase catalytic domain-containing protein [Candidatus Dormibacteraeota bacterium]